MNNVFTAMNGVWMKKAAQSGKCSKLGVMYYNSLFSAIAMIAFFVIEYNLVHGNFSSIIGSSASSSTVTAFDHNPLAEKLDPIEEELGIVKFRKLLSTFIPTTSTSSFNYFDGSTLSGESSSSEFSYHPYSNNYLGGVKYSNLDFEQLFVNPGVLGRRGLAVPGQIASGAGQVVIHSEPIISTFEAAIAHPGWGDSKFIGNVI